MTSFYSKVSEILRKRAAYARTVAEIESMPLDVALDLDIYRGDAHKIATKVVYGH